MFRLYKRWIAISENNMNNINRYTPLPSTSWRQAMSMPTKNSPARGVKSPDEEDRAQDDDNNATINFDLSESSYEEIFTELAKSIDALLKLDNYTTQKALEHTNFISRVAQKARDDSKHAQEISEKMASLNFVELFQKMWSVHFRDDLFELADQDVTWLNMHMMKDVMWNMSDKSNAFCDRIIKINLHSELIGYLKSASLAPNRLEQKTRCDIVQGFIGTLHNIVQRASRAREALRECGSVDILQTFRECEQEMVSCMALMIQAYLVSEEENEKINSDIEIFKLLIELLQGSIEGQSRFSVRFAVMEVLEAINKLAANDSNKERIVNVGALPYYVRLLAAGRPEVEQKEAARGLWILGFKCKKDIQNETGCIEALKSLQERSTIDDVKKQVEGALWILQDTGTEGQPRPKTSRPGAIDDDDGGHVFISYQWDAKTTVLKVRDRLKDAGFRVWIDEDNMSGSVLEAMAMAVEKAVVVIICLSQKYKDSPSCRTEAEYTFRLRKKIVPLRLQTKYYPDGWLGILVGSQLVFDCSQPNKVEESCRHLIKELGSMGRAGGQHVDEVDSPIKAQVASLTTAAYPSHEKTSQTQTWSRDDIDAWLDKHNLQHLNDWFSTFTGPLLLEYNSMRQDAPEAFFAYLMKRDLPLTDTLKLSRALKELI